jgi:hypothetical protein
MNGIANIDNSIFHQKKRSETASGFCRIITVNRIIKVKRMINFGFDMHISKYINGYFIADVLIFPGFYF